MPVLRNPRHEAYAVALAKGMTADSAYQAAGYKPNRGNASELKSKEIIVTRVAEIMGKAAGKVETNIARWTQEVSGIAFSDIREVLEFGPRGVRLKEGVTLTPEQAALIAEVSDTKDGQRVKLHSKMDALEKLAKRFGWYAPEQHDVRVLIEKIERVIVDGPVVRS